MKIYAWYCPVCVEIKRSETCPKCPGVLLLKVYKELEDDHPRWRTLS